MKTYAGILRTTPRTIYSSARRLTCIVRIYKDKHYWTPRAQLAGSTKSIHRSNKNATKIPPLLSIFDFDACYEGSTGGQIGVEFNQKSNGDVGFFPALLLADQ